MSNDYVIRVEHLSKIYKLYDKPIDRLKETLHPFKKRYHHDFAALNDVSFEVKKGTTLGIIGKNGCGKSTLLKILTGVLTPSSGKVETHGQISALLELGAGFNPEFTGLENIYLNGSIMGFSRAEVEQKLDSILAFADIGEFIHQPVKVYSSGMYVRLAFAIAVAVEPQILIVDEALAVGDMRFQQKCLRKMREIQENGCTVLFVGHDLGAVNSFCENAIWLDRGQLKLLGKAADVTKTYLSAMAYEQETEIKTSQESVSTQNANQNVASWRPFEKTEHFGDGGCEISAFQLMNRNTNKPVSVLKGGEILNLKFLVKVNEPVLSPILGFILKNRLGIHVIDCNSFICNAPIVLTPHRENVISIDFKLPHLSNGDYALTVGLADGTQVAHVQKHWIHDFAILTIGNPDLRYQMSSICVIDSSVKFESFVPS